MTTRFTTRVRRADGTGCAHAFDTECDRCAIESTQPIHMPAVVSFPETVYEHIFGPDERPYPISSREQLRRECIERGVTSNYLRESIVHRSGETKWF